LSNKFNDYLLDKRSRFGNYSLLTNFILIITHKSYLNKIISIYLC
jgi:hypothetical protein